MTGLTGGCFRWWIPDWKKKWQDLCGTGNFLPCRRSATRRCSAISTERYPSVAPWNLSNATPVIMQNGR